MNTLTIEQVKTQIDELESKIVSLKSDIDNYEVEISEEQFDEFLDDCYGDVEVCGFTYNASYALKELDPTAYRCAKSDYESNYDLDDCEEYQEMADELEELESDLESLNELLDELECENDE